MVTNLQHWIILAASFATQMVTAQDLGSIADRNNSWDPIPRPEVIVQSVDKVINAGILKPNNIEITFNFWVEADSDSVNLTCLASNMASKRGSTEDSKRKLDTESGCRITTVDALSVTGQSTETVNFKSERHKIDGQIDALKSDYVTFKTLGLDNFRRNVFVTVTWNGTARANPVGSYEASVMLIADVPDNVHPPK